VIADLKPYSLILVCIVPNVRDMEIARLLGWYRIPFRSAPKVVDVDFLAFYQPSVFPAPEGGKINYLAQVKGHEMTSRAELFREEADSPRANEEYFKIQIGPLLRLDTPVEASGWKRITFLYTTGEYLVRSRTIQDLVVHSEERSILWRSLRERQQNAQDTYSIEEENPLDPKITEWLGYLYFKTDHMNRGG
jgi:hypothetical protein